MRILGIDPGLRRTGYGCVDCASPAETPNHRSATTPARAHHPNSIMHLAEAGVIRLDPRLSVADRLCELERDVIEVVHRLKPDLLAVEKLYAHYKHPTTAIIMGHARGVILLVGRRTGLQLLELGATEVKKSTTGNGHAGKRQVERAVAVHLGIASLPGPSDVADAVAIAMCAARRSQVPPPPEPPTSRSAPARPRAARAATPPRPLQFDA